MRMDSARRELPFAFLLRTSLPRTWVRARCDAEPAETMTGTSPTGGRGVSDENTERCACPLLCRKKGLLFRHSLHILFLVVTFQGIIYLEILI